MQTQFFKSVTLQALRDYILDQDINETATILLHQLDYDSLLLDYRETYRERVVLPFYLMGVLIKEDDIAVAVPNHVQVIPNSNFTEPGEEANRPAQNENADQFKRLERPVNLTESLRRFRT